MRAQPQPAVSPAVSPADWHSGYGAIRHQAATVTNMAELAARLTNDRNRGDGQPFYALLHAADRVASAGMWLVVHQTYAHSVYLDGRPLAPEDFKEHPEGHTGGSLNMVPAYVGYLLANALTGLTRSWLMGQGHCVSAIDSVNVLVDNMTDAHAARYGLSDAGLTRYVRDFYSYRLGADGQPDSPLGSHVNAYTAGGTSEGGYLGFAELEYVHMPLPGERLVVFLSDGAFEEQRGSDWAPRWWRAEDSGLVTPIMIANGRRIDQRTTVTQQGGVEWLLRHLELNGFDPFVIDGHDPAAFAWAILHMEARLEALGVAARAGLARYPVKLPYCVAVARKGAGFYGAGTNLAHNLPLGTNPHTDPEAAAHFNEHARRLWVPLAELRAAAGHFQQHAGAHPPRPRERDHPLATRDVHLAASPEPRYTPLGAEPTNPITVDRSDSIDGAPSEQTAVDRSDPAAWTFASPMAAVDAAFLATVQLNPHLRPRVGNPDEMKSNRMLATLEALKFRVTAPEPGIPEALLGAVVTALNEEAVAAVALGNKGGLNLAVTYEAFGMKMEGEFRQEIIFADHLNAAGRPPGWLSVPLVLTSHTWENAKNERSHQDPSMAEALLGEPADVARVVFVPDFNTAWAVMRALYRTRGQYWTLVVPKAESVPVLFTAGEAEALVADGGLHLAWAGHEPDEARVILVAVGAYQLGQVLRAGRRLAERGVRHRVVYLLEPARFQVPRNAREEAHMAPAGVAEQLFPDGVPARVFLTHTRPAIILGLLARFHTGAQTAGLGYANHGGTLTTPGMLFVNRCTWAHCVERAAQLLGEPRAAWLDGRELAALDGLLAPEGILF